MKETGGKTIFKKFRKKTDVKSGSKTRKRTLRSKPVKHVLSPAMIIAIRYFLVICFAVIVLFGGLLIHYSMSPVDDKNATVILDIPTGSGFLKVTNILDEAGLVKNKFLFNLLAVVKKATRVIRAGEYEFNTSMTPSAILRKLVRGDIKKYRVTIPEDFNVRDIARRLDDYRLIDKKTFLELARDKKFLASMGIEADSIEGYLFPDTYNFHRSMSTRQIMSFMVSQFWKKVTPEMAEEAAKRGLTLHQLITFASLIGKESGYYDEKNLISAVFHNRLKKKRRLQSDPTTVYDLDDFQGKILKSHLKRKSPYNTYLIDGLPPGPIANPGLSSIRAVLNPAPVNYLYFVSKNDGTHAFSETLEQHYEAIKELRRFQQEAKANNLEK